MPKNHIKLPDIGDFEEVEVIEVLVSVGENVEAETPLLTLESEKASMEIPSPVSGTITEVLVKVGDKISQGSDIVVCDVSAEASPADNADKAAAPSQPASAPATAPAPPASAPKASPASAKTAASSEPARRAGAPVNPTPDSVYASPSVRKLARGLGVDLTQTSPSGSRGRILQGDVHNYVKDQLSNGSSRGSALLEGIEPLAPIDFSQFGKISTESLSRINQLSAMSVTRSSVVAPHVTQFDEADIGALEEMRAALNRQHKDDGIKFTFLAFLIKAVVRMLQKMPRLNSSLSEDKKSLIVKHYYHIGIAVDTPAGLVVPVLRDADQKSLKEIALELVDISSRARARKLATKDVQGASFTISSLGGIGGTGFTPIINLPEVAILGVSRSSIKPHWDGEKFVPVNKLPLCLSYDHRVVDGAGAARFTTGLAKVLANPDSFSD